MLGQGEEDGVPVWRKIQSGGPAALLLEIDLGFSFFIFLYHTKNYKNSKKKL